MSDNTKGINAFIELSKAYYIGPKNLDVGGDPTIISAIENLLDISNTVYNPCLPTHNILTYRKYDTVTSFSILNVLVKKEDDGQYVFDKEEARFHIDLCIWSLMPHRGILYIKLYEGDRTGKCGIKSCETYFQTNMHWLKYYPFLLEIFCKEDIYVDHVNKVYVIKIL